MSGRAVHRPTRICAASAAWLVLVSGCGYAPDVPRGARASQVFAFDGLELANLRAAGANLTISLRKAEIRKQHYGVFSVRHLREVHVEQAHVRVERPPSTGRAESDGRSARATGIELPSLGRLGVVTRILVRDLDLELRRGEAIEFRLSAERAGVGRSSAVELRDLVLRASDGTLLRARAARLEQWERLEIRGGYALERGGASVRGSRASFELGAGGTVRTLRRKS